MKLSEIVQGKKYMYKNRRFFGEPEEVTVIKKGMYRLLIRFEDGYEKYVTSPTLSEK